MTKHPEVNHLASEERIRAIAYSLWEEEGRPDGRAEAHWLKACEIVAAEAKEPDWLKRQEAPKIEAANDERHGHRRRVA